MRRIKALSKNLLFHVFLTLVAGLLLSKIFPLYVVQFFYSISCTIKDILILFLPAVIFSYLTTSIISYKNNAPKLIFYVLFFMIMSLLLALVYVFFVGYAFLPKIVSSKIITNISDVELVKPLWLLSINGFATDKTMIFAMFFGLWLNFLRASFLTRLRNSHYDKMEGTKQNFFYTLLKSIFTLGVFSSDYVLEKVENFLFKMKDFSEKYLLKFFVPIIPLYIFGFILKLSSESVNANFWKDFSRVFIFNLICILFFIMIAYFIIAKFNMSCACKYIKNMFPATITAFSTMSSVATMPVTIQCCEKNIGEDGFSKFVVPTTVNVHAIGDVIDVALCGLALLLISGGVLPNIMQYSVFAFYLCIAQFSCVSIPGGGIIIMTAILQKYLGLSAEATMLLTSIYFLQEPFLTASSVTYNGAFTIFLKRLLKI